MANTFSLILVIVTLVTGIVWTLEKLVWAKKRQQKQAHLQAQTPDMPASALDKVAAQRGGLKTVSRFSLLLLLCWYCARSFMNRSKFHPVR